MGHKKSEETAPTVFFYPEDVISQCQNACLPIYDFLQSIVPFWDNWLQKALLADENMTSC